MQLELVKEHADGDKEKANLGFIARPYTLPLNYPHLKTVMMNQ